MYPRCCRSQLGNNSKGKKVCSCCNSEGDTALRTFSKVLGCPCRWKILRIIGKGKIASAEIHEELKKHGERFSKAGLYYHLKELERAEIIAVAGYREEKGGAPEKMWKVVKRKIEIELLS